MRKLAAIMFTDIVGYTALMGEDENKALQILEQNRQFLKPIVQKNGGEWLKEIGDGTLSSFASALDAVNCAKEIQQLLHNMPDLTLRIGIHIGDVVFESGDVFGDGVNVASRLEPLAPPGGICISGRVQEDVKNKPEISTVFIGQKKLKNVDRPISIYALKGEGLPLPPEFSRGPVATLFYAFNKSPRIFLIPSIIIATIIGTVTWTLQKRYPASFRQKAVVVMPFENLTGDSTLAIWEKGIPELLITALSSSQELQVVETSTTYDVLESMGLTRTAQIVPSIARQIAARVEVGTYVRGNILASGDRLSVQAKLLDSKSGLVLKSELASGETQSDFFQMINTLSAHLKDYLEVRQLERDVDYDVREATTNSAEAFRHYIRGIDLFNELDYPAAILSLRKSVAIDMNFALAYAYLAIAAANYGMVDSAKHWLDMAVKQREKIPYKHQLILDAETSLFNKKPYEAINRINELLEIDPQLRNWWFSLGYLYYSLHQYENAVNALERAMELGNKWGNPWKWPPLYSILGAAYHKLDRHRAERKVYSRGFDILPNHPLLIRRMAIEYLARGDTIHANQYLRTYESELVALGRERSKILYALGGVYYDAGYLHIAEDVYRKAVQSDSLDHRAIGELALLLMMKDDQVENGIELAHQALDLSPGNSSYLSTLGWGYYKLKQYDTALSILETAEANRSYYDHEIQQRLELARIALNDTQ